MIERLFGLHLNLGITFAVGLLLVFSGIVVEFHVRALVMFRGLRVAEHLRTGFFIVVIVELDLAGPESSLARPLVDMLLLATVSGRQWNEGNRGEAGQRRVRRFRIGENQ